MSHTLWHLREVRPDRWWASDCTTGTAYALAADTGAALWTRHDLMGLTLRAAIEASVVSVLTHHFADLQFDGLTVRYSSTSPVIIERILNDFSGARPRLRHSPDVLVELTEDADIDRLHRAVDVDRRGVRLRRLEDAQWAKGEAAVPVLPPLQLPFFADRFCGLHASLVQVGGRLVAFCGHQKSGKTTIAVAALEAGRGSVLGDELLLLGRAGVAVPVPLPIRHRRSNVLQPVRIPRPRVLPSAQSLSAFVILGLPGQFVPLEAVATVEDSMRLVRPHVRPLTGALYLATLNLLEAFQHARVYSCTLGAWPRLATDADELIELLAARDLP